MKVYLQSKEYSQELESRREYLYDTTNLWFYVKNTRYGFVELESFPAYVHDEILFIFGHDPVVSQYLAKIVRNQRVVVAVTCNTFGLLNRIDFKGDIYVPVNMSSTREVELLDGKKLGFSFDITESELRFYQSDKSRDLISRIKESFDLLSGRELDRKRKL